MPEPKKPMPESVLPSLRNKALIRGQEGGKNQVEGTDYGWGYAGYDGYKQEIGSFFGQEVFDFCLKRLIENKGKLKIVSFGGGELISLLQLRMGLINDAEKQGVEAEIKIVDYALSRELALEGLERTGNLNLLADGSIMLKPGKLELRQIKDAEGADVMLSRRGPFEKVAAFLETELIQKAVVKLAPGGIAYLEVKNIKAGGEKIIADKLGNNFTVIPVIKTGQRISECGCYYKITRLK